MKINFLLIAMLAYTTMFAQNVGIGTTTPNRLLTVKTNGIGVTQQSADGSTEVGFYTGSGAAYIQTNTNHNLNFATNNGSSQMTLATTGNVGIGNSSPANKLTVQTFTGNFGLVHTDGAVSVGTYVNSAYGGSFGTKSNHPLYFFTNNGGYQMALLQNGNVGIGTISPSAKLEVAGAVKIADGTQGNGKVLTSDANGNASWQASAYNNIERFSFDNFFFQGSGASFITNYNTGTCTGSSGSGSNTTNERQSVIQFTKIGLYHFSINTHGILDETSSSAGAITFDISDNHGRHYVYANNSPLFLATNIGISDVRGYYDKEIDIYIDQPEILTFLTIVYNGGNTFTLNELILTITGHLIAD